MCLQMVKEDDGDGRPGPDLGISDGFMLEHHNLQYLRILMSIKVI